VQGRSDKAATQDQRIALLFNPRTQDWNDHFRWSINYRRHQFGADPYRRATVATLAMNSPVLRMRARVNVGLLDLIPKQPFTHPRFDCNQGAGRRRGAGRLRRGRTWPTSCADPMRVAAR